MPSAAAVGALAVGVQADNDVVAAVAEVLRLGMSLAAVSHDGDGLTLQDLRFCVTLVKNSSHRCAPLVHKGRKGTLAF